MSTTETTADKLAKLLSTKQAIKEAIIEKGGTVDSDVFDTYADAIRDIPTGGSSSKFWCYGYDLDLTDQNPETRVSYPSDVDNADFERARMDFTNDVFLYGGWNFAPGEKFMPRPCMLKYDGTVDYYLDPNDYTKREDGTASDVANINYGGNVMVEWGKIYVKRWGTEGFYHFRCSNAKLDEDYECWSNYDINNNEIDHFYTAVYYGKLDNSSCMRSISGTSITSTSLLVPAIITSAEKNGANMWYTAVLSDQKLLEDLTVMMTKSTDSQTAVGQGNSDTVTYLQNGTLDTKGMFWGSDNAALGVKLFGMENLWGNRSRFLSGLIATKNKIYIKMTRGTKDGSSGTDYNRQPSNYIELPLDFHPTRENGYASTSVATSYGRYSTDNTGSSTTYDADTLGYNSTALSKYVMLAELGGSTSSTKYAGLFYCDFHLTAENSHIDMSTLSCKPLAPTT